MYISTILDIFSVLKKEAIVDWYKNVDVKRKMRSSVDDYLYDVLKVEKDISIDNSQAQFILNTIMQLAENNFEIIS